MHRSTAALSSALTLAALVLSLAAPQPARACGGFFCNNSQPVNQAAERIIFAVSSDGTVTATIQIQYSGEASSFAWVLPVSGSPEIHVSSDVAFQRLQAATNPSYILTTRTEGTCRDGGGFGPTAFPGAGRSDAAAAAADAAGPVRVVNQGNVGPYDFVVISVDSATALVTDAAVEWLEVNGYQIDPAGAARLAPYLEAGMNLLAFRLTSGNPVGSIRPVEITFGAGTPAIPIRPTAVAAVADMGVMVWVLGHARAIPENYMSLELNEALINWLSPGSNYNAVVNEAANQAGGQGFVTEMAGDAAPLAPVIFAEWEVNEWANVRGAAWTDRESELLQRVLGNFGSLDGMRDALAATLTVPDGYTIDDVLGCVGCVYGWDATDISGFEPVAFLDAVEASVIEPMERTRALFESHTTMTRFYTTMSADEMTRDPSFAFNSNLDDVSNIHNATRVIECSPSVRFNEAAWRVELPGGDTVRGTGATWPFTPTDGSMPANTRILRLETDGAGVVVVDNTASIATSLETHNVGIPRIETRSAGGGGACSAGRSGESGLPVLVLGVALALLQARRRRG